LLNLRVSCPKNRPQWQDFKFDGERETTAAYSVVTLNYDRVLETVCDFVESTFPANNKSTGAKVGFVSDGSGTVLAKLHGSTDKGDIVPPTWSKGVLKSVHMAWKSAFEVLSKATQIRVLGYSLPVADAYVKYLLKAAVCQEQHVQKIDIISRDMDGSTERRFREFITFNYMRFHSGDIAEYLETNMKLTRKNGSNRLVFDRLEDAHERFMRGEIVKSWHS
jgi:hypothetical protein